MRAGVQAEPWDGPVRSRAEASQDFRLVDLSPLVEKVELNECRIVRAEDLPNVARKAVMGRAKDCEGRYCRNDEEAYPRVPQRNKPKLLYSKTSRH